MAICPNCSSEMPEGIRFCSECGAKLEAAAAPFAQPAFTPELLDLEPSVTPEAPAAPMQPEAPAPAAFTPPVTVEAPAPAEVPASPARPAYPAQAAPTQPTDDRPHRKSRYAPMTSAGMALELFLMGIPVLGLIFMILWSCGVCRKIARRNLARAALSLWVLALVVLIAAALVCRFVFPNEITALFESLVPGYTIQWG